jgi:hypothetical protein
MFLIKPRTAALARLAANCRAGRPRRHWCHLGETSSDAVIPAKAGIQFSPGWAVVQFDVEAALCRHKWRGKPASTSNCIVTPDCFRSRPRGLPVPIDFRACGNDCDREPRILDIACAEAVLRMEEARFRQSGRFCRRAAVAKSAGIGRGASKKIAECRKNPRSY